MEFKDNYKWLSGWIHDYYCDKDGSELIFDINNYDYFECPICHHKYTDKKRKNAWITKYRYKIFENLEKYSEKYIVEKSDIYLKFIESALSYYSSNYNNFLIHNKDGEIFNSYDNESNRCGRITAQGLNEAMISIQMVNCINNINGYLNDDIKQNVFNKLFQEIYKLLKPQVNKIHNIKCYEVCAIGMMGIISKNSDMIDFAFNSPYSFYTQLNKGITKDYFWFEGSFHYHFFVLKPILKLLNIAKEYDYDIQHKYYKLAKNMLIQGYKCTFNDCSLPSPNDGWPNRNLYNYLDVYILGNQIFKNEFSDIIKSINNKNNEFNNTIHMINTGFSNLKNKYWNIFIKYNDNDLSHAHPDKLNIEIKHENKFLTHDLSTSGYGSNISNEFYKKTYSHNTIVVDGNDQNLECKSTIKLYSNNAVNLNVKDIDNGVSVSRKIELLSNIINDEIVVNCNNNNIIDLFFHSDAKLITKFSFNNINCFQEYPYLKNIKEVIHQNYITLEWKLGSKIIYNKIDLKNKQLFICESPDNPDTKKRTTMIIRSCNSNNISFNIKWEII